MGFLGLTTFVNCNPQLTEEFPLHSTRVVIDGNSLYHFIFEDTHMDFYHGGDYDQYAFEITEFLDSFTPATSSFMLCLMVVMIQMT